MIYVNLLFGIVIFACTIYVSFNHSIYLFHIGGYLGTMAIAGVIAGETLYAMGIVNTVKSLMSKTPAPVSARIATIIGTLMVGWSNIYAGWEKWTTEGNPIGIILGIAIMSYLWVADWIIVETLSQFLKKDEETEEEQKKVMSVGLSEYFRDKLEDTNDTFENETSQFANPQFVNTQIANMKSENEDSQNADVESETTNSQNTNSQFANTTSQITDPQIADVQSEDSHSQIANEESENTNVVEAVNAQATNEKSENADSQNTNSQIVDAQIADEKFENATSQIVNENFETTNPQITNENSQNADVESEDSQITNVRSEDASSQITNEEFENTNSQVTNEKSENANSQNLFEKYTTQIANEENEAVRHAMKCAIEYHIENNKFPTIEGLVEIAEVSTWHARLALNKLRGKRKKRRKVS